MIGSLPDLHGWTGRLLQVLGILLTWAILIDVFLTVLYARFGTSLLSLYVGRGVWALLKFLARPFSYRMQGILLSFGGPLIMAALVLVWAITLTLGAGLLLWPEMADGIKASGGMPTPTNFVSALFAGASSMSMASSGQFSPQKRWLEVVFMFNSLVGISMLPLVMTYFLEVFNALQNRNTVALRLHLATLETGDAAQLIGSLLHTGDISESSARLRDIATASAGLREAAHFYSLLIYFRFREPHYAVARLVLVLLDTVALVQTALDEERWRLLQESDGAAVLARSAMHLVHGLGQALHQTNADKGQVDDAARDLWRKRYFRSLQSLREHDIPVTKDPEAGVKRYIQMRETWDPLVTGHARHMGYHIEEIDIPTWSDAPPVPPPLTSPPITSPSQTSGSAPPRGTFSPQHTVGTQR